MGKLTPCQPDSTQAKAKNLPSFKSEADDTIKGIAYNLTAYNNKATSSLTRIQRSVNFLDYVSISSNHLSESMYLIS